MANLVEQFFAEKEIENSLEKLQTILKQSAQDPNEVMQNPWLKTLSPVSDDDIKALARDKSKTTNRNKKEIVLESYATLKGLNPRESKQLQRLVESKGY